jgi:K+-transporting ATPase ATPase C chain
MKQLKITGIYFLIMSLILGILYPLAMAGFARLAFPEKAGGTLIVQNGRIAGSELIGQNFSGPRYFHGRPSANNYDGTNSGGSNLGPTNRKLVEQASKLAEQIRQENDLPAGAKVPADLILASGSGLDPHISMEAALVQAARVARERKVDVSVVNNMVRKNSERSYFNSAGSEYVNVLKLNMALDNAGKSK